MSVFHILYDGRDRGVAVVEEMPGGAFKREFPGKTLLHRVQRAYGGSRSGAVRQDISCIRISRGRKLAFAYVACRGKYEVEEVGEPMFHYSGFMILRLGKGLAVCFSRLPMRAKARIRVPLYDGIDACGCRVPIPRRGQGCGLSQWRYALGRRDSRSHQLHSVLRQFHPDAGVWRQGLSDLIFAPRRETAFVA